MNLIAIVPARGNSKRIAKKNLLKIKNKRILKILFENLRNFKIFEEIFLTSEDKEIQGLAKKIGFKVINRPEKLSNDITSTVDVIKHSVNFLQEKLNFSHVCCIYPFAVLLTKKDFIKSFKILKKNSEIIFPAIRYGHPIQRAFEIKANNLIKYSNSKLIINKQTQLFKSYFHDAGQFYLGHKKAWMSYEKSKKKCFEIENFRAVDVDNISDFKLLKLLYFSQKG